MNQNADDYVWDPRATPDREIAALERSLQPFSARARGLAERDLPLPRGSVAFPRWRRVRRVVLAAAATLAAVYVVHVYRLSWPEDSPWPLTIARQDGTTSTGSLRVDEALVTDAEQTARLSVARIGTVVVAPNSVARLIRTRRGQHRLELERGRLHARIWAPPNHFGVTHGDLRFVDLGCEFDLSVDTSGSGTLTVDSGWVVHRHGAREILVPEGYVLAFDTVTARSPVRADATAQFRADVIELDARMQTETTTDDLSVLALTDRLATSARDEDYFTLLDLLVRHPRLAGTPLYPRLAAVLRLEAIDDSHRARWASGDTAAREEWWDRLPKQPKMWWLNWCDAI